jgi:hypothetical protein
MNDTPSAPPRARPLGRLIRVAVLAGGLGLAASACDVIDDILGNEPDGPGGFDPRVTHVSVEANVPFVMDGRYFAFQTVEAITSPHGKDFNGDGDFQDSIAVVVDLAGETEKNLKVATKEIAILGSQIYVVVAEDLDGRDWDLDGVQDDLVLLHFAFGAGPLTFVATLSRSGEPTSVVESGDRLFFVDAPALPLVAPDTTVSYVTEAAPRVPVRVQNADPLNTLDPVLLSSDEGLVFALQDEAREGRDLNADLDLEDQHVLALVDGTEPVPLVRGVGLAVRNREAPVRALDTGVADWLVGFLVDEADQGATNLNDPLLFDPAWQPLQCIGLGDVDAEDAILHFLHFAAWVQDPLTNPPVNTGLTGALKVLAVPGTGGSPGFVATISPELDEGTCSLNNDPNNGNDVDQEDLFVRWVEASVPVLPAVDVDQLIAMSLTPGGAQGASDMFGRLVATLSEFFDSRDYDGNPLTLFGNMLAWVDPNDGPSAAWVFDHGAPGISFAGAGWMKEDREHGRLLLGFQEIVFGQSLNPGDNDLFDDVPVFARFDPANPDDMDFPGPPIAVETNDANIVLGGVFAFYRTSEGSSSKAFNGDNDRLDNFLSRTKVDDARKSHQLLMLENSPQAGDPSATILGASDFGAAWIALEFRDKRDWNGDGDTQDLVIRWFRLQ